MKIEPSDPAMTSAGTWERAVDEANAWRGRCLNHLSKAEAKVTEALIALEMPDRPGAKAKLPHLVGQRFGALAKLVEPGGAYAKEGSGCDAVLSEAREYLRLRNFLCHGAGKVYLDRSGKWLLVLALTEVRSGKADTDKYSITQDEANKVAEATQKVSQRLGGQLDRLLHAVAKTRRT